MESDWIRSDWNWVCFQTLQLTDVFLFMLHLTSIKGLIDSTLKMEEKKRKRKNTAGKRCAAMFCGNTYKDSSDKVGLFTWPKPDKSPERHKAWTKVVETTRSNFVYNEQSSFLCSDHFESTQFDPSNAMKRKMGLTKSFRLAGGAVPSSSLLPPRPTHSAESSLALQTPRPTHSAENTSQSRLGSQTPTTPRVAYQKRERKRVSYSLSLMLVHFWLVLLYYIKITMS